MTREFIVTADAHMVEPSDLFKTRLPKHLRERADDQRKAILGGTLAGLVGFEPAKTPA